MNPEIHNTICGGAIKEYKQMQVNGVPVGVFEGFLATWDIDTGGMLGIPDQFVKGAFTDSLQEHKDRSNRQIRLADHHGRTIGGFPIELAVEDEIGLKVTGHVNLEVEQGREAFALVKQGVITDLSIGWSSLEDEITNNVRVITKAIIWEGSFISEPANRAARITEVKKLNVDEIKKLSPRELESYLIDLGLSHKAARYLIHKGKEERLQAILDDLNATRRGL
jgi:hypothetical protein